ncbi:RNA polymerase sigma factor [Candidatus Poribacteria bacterium]
MKSYDVMEKMNDEQLVKLVWNRNADAFGVLALRYQKGLYQFALTRTQNPDDAQDCSQEALLRAYQAMTEKQNPREPAKFWGYIRSIAYNVAMDRHRERKRAAELGERMNLGRGDDSDYGYDDGLYMEMSEMVDRLPRKERRVIMLYYFEGHSVDKIAEIEGFGQPWVSKKKRRGEELLRKMIKRTRGGD